MAPLWSDLPKTHRMFCFHPLDAVLSVRIMSWGAAQTIGARMSLCFCFYNMPGTKAYYTQGSVAKRFPLSCCVRNHNKMWSDMSLQVWSTCFWAVLNWNTTSNTFNLRGRQIRWEGTSKKKTQKNNKTQKNIGRILTPFKTVKISKAFDFTASCFCWADF